MKRAAWLLLAVGCAHPARHAGPGGEPLVDVACTAREDCEAQARKLCGSDIMIEHEEDHSRQTDNGPAHEVTMTARCVVAPKPLTR